MQTSFLAQMRNVLGVSLLAISLVSACPADAFSKAKAVSHKPAEEIDDDASPSIGGSTVQPLGSIDHVSPGDALAGFGPSSGTVVGNRALELRDEVLRLRASVNLNSNEFSLQRANGAAGAVQYHSTVAAITARLQNGTTRGNPILLRQWDEAEASLNEVATSMNRLNSLQTSVAADASLAGYLLESVQAAFQLSGAVDEDHDQLKLLRDEVSHIVVQVDYLRNQIANDIQRQTLYATTERSNLQTLAFAISRGELLTNSSSRQVIVNQPSITSLPPAQYAPQAAPPAYAPRAAAAPYAATPSAAPVAPVGEAPLTIAPATSAPAPVNFSAADASAAQQATAPADASTTGRLLVLIRFNKPTVDYEQQLSQAINSALERRPTSEFSVVAVSPTSGDANDIVRAQDSAARNAETVKQSLIQLGIPASKITMSNTQTASAQTAEVHVYVR